MKNHFHIIHCKYYYPYNEMVAWVVLHYLQIFSPKMYTKMWNFFAKRFKPRKNTATTDNTDINLFEKMTIFFMLIWYKLPTYKYKNWKFKNFHPFTLIISTKFFFGKICLTTTATAIVSFQAMCIVLVVCTWSHSWKEHKTVPQTFQTKIKILKIFIWKWNIAVQCILILFVNVFAVRTN